MRLTRGAVFLRSELKRGLAAVLWPVSVMITGLYKINPFMPNNIYKPMFLRNSARPNTWPKKFKRFGLADPLERVSHYRFDQLKNSKGGFAVRLHPVPQILPKLLLEHWFPLYGGLRCFRRTSTQNQPRFEGRQSFVGCQFLSGPYQER
jgi:hypothetical protein